MHADCRGVQFIAYLKGFIENVGHLILEVLRCGEGTGEEERAGTASVNTNSVRGS